MATYTSLINSVLRRVRESEVAGPTSTTYAALVGDFVNETKREVEDAWKWSMLRQTISVNTVQSADTLSVLGAGNRWKLQDPLYSVYNATSKDYLCKANNVAFERGAVDDVTEGTPAEYVFEGQDANGDPEVRLYRIPDGVYAINFKLIVPQDDFSLGTEVLKVPDYPVLMGAIAKALAERGEDNGSTSGEGYNRYQLALNDAISVDEARTTAETTWYV